LCDDIEGVDSGERDLVDHHGPQGVEQDLEGAEECFSCDRVEEDGFKVGGEVDVYAIYAEGFMVCEMVGLCSGLEIETGYDGPDVP
jgi:hypothetical protein